METTYSNMRAKSENIYKEGRPQILTVFHLTKINIHIINTSFCELHALQNI